MFAVRIVTTDHYQGPPIPGLDVQYADFRASVVKKVPVIRVFGSTPQGQKTCMHVHGVFPYLYVLYDGTQPWDRYLRLFANSLDKAINVAQGNASAETQHVYKINMVSGIPMYGFYEREQQFLKIYFYNPNIIRRAADLLLGGAVLNKGFQPHESHIPYTLQMFIDYNLYGMNMLNVAAVKFRRKAQDENANPNDPESLHQSDPTTPTSPDGSLQDWLNNASLSPSQPLWNSDTISRDMYLGSDVLRQSTCELEVDVVAADILNRQEVDANVGNNPGLAALWEDERQRKRNVGQSSQITPPASQERVSVEISDSDQALSDRFREIVLSQLPYLDSQSDSISESSQEDIIPSQAASSVDLHSTQNEDVEDVEASQSTVILEEEEEEDRAAIVNMDSIHRVVSMSQHFSATPLSQQSDEPQDRSLAALLASLADDSSPPATQAAAGEVTTLEEKDSILLDAAVVPDDETTEKDEAETLEMSQVVWEDGSQDSGEGRERKCEEFDLEGLDTTWNDSQAVPVSDEEGDTIPQFDGANDEKPQPAKKSKKKRLGTTGPVVSGFDKTPPSVGLISQSGPFSPEFSNPPQGLYGPNSNQYPSGSQYDFQGQGYGMEFGAYSYSQWNPQGSYGADLQQGFGMQTWGQQTPWNSSNPSTQQQCPPEGQGLPSPQGQLQPRLQGSHRNLPQSQNMSNSPRSQHSPQGLQSPHSLTSPHGLTSPHSLSSPQGLPSPHGNTQGNTQSQNTSVNSPVPLNIGAPMSTFSSRTRVQGHGQNQGQGYPPSVMESRDSFSALMNDETLSNNLWNFSEFGGISDSDGMLSQGESSMTGQIGTVEKAMEQMYYPQNQPNFLSQGSHSMTSSQGHLTQFPSGQPGMTSTPVGGSQNSQESKTQQGVNSNCQQIFPRLAIQPSSQTFSNSQSGTSQGHYPEFSGYSQQEGFSQHNYSNTFSSSYSKYSSQTSPKNSTLSVNESGLTSTPLDTSQDSAMSNRNYSGQEAFSSKSRLSAEPRDFNTQQYHMPSGGNFSGDSDGSQQNSSFSSHASSQFSNSQPLYQSGSLSHVSDSQRSDNASSSFSPHSHSYKGPQPSGQCYNSQPNLSTPHWGPHMSTINDNPTTTVKKRSSKKKENGGTTTAKTKKKATPKKSTKKSSSEDPKPPLDSPNQSSLGSMLQASSLGSVLKKSNSFQPRGVPYSGGNLLEKLLLANEEEGGKLRKPEPSVPPCKSLSSPGSLLHTSTDSTSPKSGSSSSSQPFSDKSETSRGPTTNINFSYQNSSGPYQTNLGPKKPSGRHQAPSGLNQNSPGPPQTLQGPHEPSGPHLTSSGPNQNTLRTYQHPLGPLQTPVSLPGSHQPSGYHQKSTGPKVLLPGPHILPSGSHQSSGGPQGIPPVPYEGLSSSSYDNKPCYLSPFRENTPDKDRQPQTTASHSVGSLFSLQNLVSNVSQKTKFGQSVRQIATDGKPYSCSESELRSYIQKNLGPVEASDSVDELGKSVDCEVPIRKPTNVSELIRSKVELESRKKRSTSASETPNQGRRHSVPSVSENRPMNSGQTNPGSISHPSYPSTADGAVSSNCSRGSVTSVDSFIRDKLSSDSSQPGHQPLPNSVCRERNKSFSSSSSGVSASSNEIVSRERTMSTSSVNNNRTEFSRSLKQKSVNRPSIVRSFSTPNPQKIIQPVKRKRGRPRKTEVTPVAVQPTKYTYRFTVPAPAHKHLQFIELSHQSPRKRVHYVHMHPMDARRYSLLKIGREVVRLKKLSVKQLGKLGRSDSPQEAEPCVRDNLQQAEPCVRDNPQQAEPCVRDNPQQAELCAESCVQAVKRGNTMPFVSEKKAYPSYEELREEVAKSKGATKLVAESEKPFAELWCVEDKTSGPQQIEKITLASIIDKAFSSMDTDEDCVGDGRRLGEDSVSNRKAQNQRASDDKGLQSRKEDRLNLLEPTSKYQGQFYKYLQRNSDAPNPMDNRTMEQLGYSTKMACSKAVQHKKKPNPHKKLPLVVDPNGEDLPDPVLQDVSLMKASRGSSIPVQSQTPVTGRSPFMHQSVPDPCQLLNSDVLDPRIKSSSKDYEHSIHEQEETDTQGGSKMHESIEKDKGRDKGWELESVTQRREDVGLMESQSSLDSQPSSASKSDSSQMDQDISDQIPTLTKEIECRTDLLDDIGRNSSTAKSSENLSLIKSNLSCPKLSVSDFTETKQPQSSKSVLNLSGNQNTPTIPQNSEKCVESLGESEGGPPSNTGSDLENMLPLSENKSEPETQSRNTCVFEGHKFEGHMTRSRSSSESNSRWQTNEDGVKKNHSETDVEKTRKSVRISRESRKRKREIPGVDYFVTGKFKGHKRMTVQLNKLNISNGTVVKLSQVFSLNSLYQKNGSNHKTVQAPEMAAHEPFCDNIFEKFKSFQDSKFFGNIVSDDSSKDSTYFQPRKSRLSLLKRGRPNDEVIEISSSEDEGRGKKVTTATEKEWGMNDSVICVEEDEYDDEMEDEKESDENSFSKTVKPSQKFIKKKKKTNKCRKIHTAFNGASYRTRKRRTRSCSGKLMTSLSVLHQATLANLIDSPLSYCESTDDYRTKYDDALFSMSLYSPPPPDELEKSPPRAQSPTDLKDIAGSPEITNVFSDLCKAMMSDDESRSPVYSPVKTKRSVLVRLNESPLKIPLGDSFEEPEIGSEKIQKGRVSVLNIHDVKRQGNDDKAKESSGYNNVGSGHHLDRSMEPVLDEPLRDEEHGAHSSDTDRDNHRTEQNTGPRLGPLHIKRKAIVRLRPLTDREIQSYCLNPAGAGKENIPVVSERESVSPPDLGPPIIPKFGKDLKQELECPPRLIRSDSYIDLYEDEAPGCLDPGSAREQDLVTSNDKFSEVYHAKKLAQKDHSRKVKGSKEESVPNSGSSETSPGGLSPTKLGAGNKTEGGHQEKTTLPRRRRPSQQGGGGERIPHSLTPTKRQVLKPKHPPPSRLRVEGTAKQYGLQCVVNQDAFCSNANDVPEKPREVGGRVLTLQNNRVTSFLEYLSTVTGEGLAAFRQILAATDRILPSQTDNQTVMDSITRDHNLRCSLLGDRRVTMVPCKLPPSQAKVRLWLEKKELYRKQRRKEKAQKQQQCNPQENQQSNLQKNQFTKIVPLIHYSQIKDKDTVRTPKTKLITKEVSFNETAEIFNMEDEVSPGEKNGVSCDKEGTELSMEEKSGSGMSSQESGDDIIGPSPPQQTCCSFRREEEEVISPSPPQLTHHSFRRDTGNIISPSPSKLTMPSVRRNSQQSGKSLTSKSRLSQLSSEEKKQSCDAVRRNLIGSVHSTPVSSRDQRSLLETINVTPISHSTDNDPENPRKRLDTPGVFLTPKRVPLPSKESVEKGDPRRSLMSSADMREMATPTNSKGNQSQIDGPTPKNSFGFKVSQHDFQKAKALHEVQNLTVMSLELHAETRRDLMPDPEVDPILAVFYNILNDVTTDAQQRDITGVILVDKKSKEIQSAIKNRKKSMQPDRPSPQPSTSRDTGSEVKPSPQPSTSRPLSPQPSTSRAPTQRGKRPRSVSPTPSPGAKVPRGEAEHTLLQKSGVDDLEVVYVENEEELFMEVLKLFSRWDPDILVGFEIQKFSWGYLLQRASQLSVNLCAQMSRIPDEKKKSSFKAESDEWGSDHSSEIHIAGRVILNLWRIIRHEVTLNIYTFENVAHHVIHQRVPHFSLQTLNSWFKHRTHLYRWRFIKYYLTRVQGNLKVIDQLDLIGRTSEFARVFGIEFYHVLSRGSQYRVESMMLRLAKPMNFIPASPSVQQRARMRAPECIALTLEPESRFYADPVVVVDFQSLYPSIMIAHNYCFSTCVGRLDLLEKAHEGPIEFGCAHLRISPKTLNRIKNDVTVSPNGVVFVKEHIRKGIISKMVEEILNTRIMVKKSMKEHKNDKGLHRLLDARQLGLKLIANVTYGYTAASFSGRMPCVEVADSIVRKARETLERAIKLVEERPEWGARVVYGDTDSMFIEMKGRSKEEAFRIGHEICDAVTAMNPQPIKLKFEKVYYPCVLQTKKRYVGYSYETLDQKEPVFDAKGIETVRRDSCAAVSKILERSIKILFGCKDVSKVKEYVLRQCRKFMEGKVSMQDCVFAKEYRGMKGYKPGACVPALEIAKKLLRHDRRSEPRTGERVPYVIIYGSPGLPLIQLVRQPGEVLSDPALRLNATYYITKQILPPLDRVFSLLGVDVFSWYNDMPKVVRVVPQSLMAPDQRKGTISQYFSATNCPVCDKQTNQPICNSCVKDPQHVCVTLCDRIRRWEKVYHDLVQVCNTCMGVKDESQPCVSLDCPIMFRRVLAKQDVQKGTQLREVVNKVLDF